MPKRKSEQLLHDTAPIKRIELHAHTKMSATRSVISAYELIK